MNKTVGEVKRAKLSSWTSEDNKLHRVFASVTTFQLKSLRKAQILLLFKFIDIVFIVKLHHNGCLQYFVIEFIKHHRNCSIVTIRIGNWEVVVCVVKLLSCMSWFLIGQRFTEVSKQSPNQQPTAWFIEFPFRAAQTSILSTFPKTR